MRGSLGTGIGSYLTNIRDQLVGGVTPIVSYLLNFKASLSDDQSLSNGQVLDTETEGVTDGSGTLLNPTAGNAELLSGQLIMNSGAFSDYYSPSVTWNSIDDTVGRYVYCKFTTPSSWGNGSAAYMIGLSSASQMSASPSVNNANTLCGVRTLGGGPSFGIIFTPSKSVTLPITPALDTAYEFIIDTMSDEFGVFYKDGGDWKIIEIAEAPPITTMYPFNSSWFTSSGTIPDTIIDEVIVPGVLNTAAITPALDDDFNRSDRDLDGDNGWSCSVFSGAGGDIQISSNQVTESSLDPNGGIATQDFSDTDAFIRFDKIDITGRSGIWLRGDLDFTDGWELSMESGLMQIIEFSSGSPTTRASASLTHNVGQNVRIHGRCSGDSIHISGKNLGNNITASTSYSSSAHNTVTTHGFMLDGGTGDNFEFYTVGGHNFQGV